jgi:hypothetical protein
MTELGKDVRFFVEEVKAADRRPQRLQEVLNGQTLELLEQKRWEGGKYCKTWLEKPRNSGQNRVSIA